MPGDSSSRIGPSSSLVAVTGVVWKPAVEKLEVLMTDQQESGFGQSTRVSGVSCGCTALSKPKTLDRVIS